MTAQFPFALRVVFLLLIAAVSARTGEPRPAPLRVFLIGDSTVSAYPQSEPTRGWGMFVQRYFKDTVKVVNRAVGGRSSKTFQREGLWGKVLREKPDFVLIQFGHNDARGPGDPVSTAPEGEYRDCLRLYVKTARQIGAVPILVTPMHFRSFSQGQFKDSLADYAEAMRRVAKNDKVPLIDLHYWSGVLFAQLGEATCEQLGDKPDDFVHFNELGAKAMAELVIRELRRVEPRLAAELVQPSDIDKTPSVEAKVSEALAVLNATMRAASLPRNAESITNSER